MKNIKVSASYMDGHDLEMASTAEALVFTL
jgi:hypothetical protein